MSAFTHKLLQEQLAMGVTLMVMEGTFARDPIHLCKNPCRQPFQQEETFMSDALHNTADAPSGDLQSADLRSADLTTSDAINRIVDQALQHGQSQQSERDYLGASRLGEPCARALQYAYTHTPKDRKYSGKTLRIFEMGHMLEKMAWQWLQKAGFEIERVKPNGRSVSQDPYGFSAAGGKLKGHVDGLIRKLPQGFVSLKDIRLPAIWECKSLNAKSWKQLVEKGLKVAKPVYAVQLALYQAYLPEGEQNPALLTAVNKDTAELYHEWVEFDAALAQEASDKAVHILRATGVGETLPRISNDPEYFACRFCDWNLTCWKGSE